MRPKIDLGRPLALLLALDADPALRLRVAAEDVDAGLRLPLAAVLPGVHESRPPELEAEVLEVLPTGGGQTFRPDFHATFPYSCGSGASLPSLRIGPRAGGDDTETVGPSSHIGDPPVWGED